MKESIDSLFCNNPDLSHRIYTYCKADPEFMEAEAEYDALLQSLEQTLGYAPDAGDRGLLPALLRPAGTSLLSLRPGPASRGSLGAGAGMIGWGILQQGSAPLPSQPSPSFVGAEHWPAHRILERREGQIPIPFVSLRSISPLDKGSRPLPYGFHGHLPSSGRGGPWASRRGSCKPRRHPHPPPSGAPVPIPSVAARHLPLIRGVGPLGGGRLAGG